MKCNRVCRAIKGIKYNQLIFVDELYKEILFNDMNEEAYFKQIERLYKKGVISKVSKGVYVKQEEDDEHTKSLTNMDISKQLIENNHGMIVGYQLFNKLHLTNYESQEYDVFSNKIKSHTKNIKDVHIHRIDIEFNMGVINSIEFLEVLDNYYNIEDMNYKALVDFVDESTSKYDEQTYEYVLENVHYAKSTIAFLKAILDHNHVKNNLDRHLSHLSKYHYPDIDILYKKKNIS